MISVFSWNVNGIRASYKKGAIQQLLELDPYLFGLQEIKSTVDQIPSVLSETLEKAGYTSSYVSPTLRKGYSGVSLHSKQQPVSVAHGFGDDVVEEMSNEGRLVQYEFDTVYVLNIYFPNGGSGPDRLDYKLKFYDHFLNHIKKLKKKKHVIFFGDINTAHTEIDLARPKENQENTGFLPIERAWIDKVITSDFVDVYRHFYPEKTQAYTYWDQKTAARDRNVGWRIDYFFCDKAFLKNISDIKIHNNIFGSDHCPLELILKLKKL